MSSMLPSYDDMSSFLRESGWGNGRGVKNPPQKSPTRKGLARYAAQCVLEQCGSTTDTGWWSLWYAARQAQSMMAEIGLRTPADTFESWRLQVRLRLQDPAVRQAHPHGEKAYKWSSR